MYFGVAAFDLFAAVVLSFAIKDMVKSENKEEESIKSEKLNYKEKAKKVISTIYQEITTDPGFVSAIICATGTKLLAT